MSMNEVDGIAVHNPHSLEEAASREAAVGRDEGTSGKTSKRKAKKKASGTQNRKSPTDLTEKGVERFVKRINRLYASTIDKGAFEIARLILDEIFGGVISDATSKNPRKSESFQKISDHPDITVDATTLSKWVRSLCMARKFQSDGLKLRYLTCSHYVELLSAKEESRLNLAQKANEKKASVRELREMIRNLNPPKALRLSEKITKSLNNPFAILRDNEMKEIMRDAQVLSAEINPAEKSLIHKSIENVRQRLQDCSQLLEEFENALNSIEEDSEEEAA